MQKNYQGEEDANAGGKKTAKELKTPTPEPETEHTAELLTALQDLEQQAVPRKLTFHLLPRAHHPQQPPAMPTAAAAAVQETPKQLEPELEDVTAAIAEEAPKPVAKEPFAEEPVLEDTAS